MLTPIRPLARSSAIAAVASSAGPERLGMHTIRGHKMAIREWGPSNGPLVIGVTGLSANSISFTDMAESLAAQGFHVVVPDLRGRNRSPATGAFTYGHENHALDLKAIADKYTASRTDKSFSTIGHSMGGLISMHLARLVGDRLKKAVLLDVLGVPELGAIASISHSVGRFDQDYASVEEFIALQRNSGLIVPFTETWRRHYSDELVKQANGRWKSRTSKDAILEDTVSAGMQFPEWYWQFLPKDTLLVKAGVPLAPLQGNVVSDWEAMAIKWIKPSIKKATIAVNHYSVITDPTSVKTVTDFLVPAKR